MPNDAKVSDVSKYPSVCVAVSQYADRAAGSFVDKIQISAGTFNFSTTIFSMRLSQCSVMEDSVTASNSCPQEEPPYSERTLERHFPRLLSAP